MNQERRYSPEETALILRRALEQRASAGAPVDADNGVTLSQLVAAAEEAGIPPDRVRRAAAALDAPPGLRTSRWLGSPSRIVTERHIERTVPADELEAFVDEVRAAAGMLGVAALSSRSAVWSSVPPGAFGTQGRRLTVALRSTDADAMLRVEEDLQPDVAGYVGLGSGVGIVGGLVAVGLLGSVAPLLALAAPVIPLAAYGLARRALRRTYEARAADVDALATRLAARAGRPMR